MVQVRTVGNEVFEVDIGLGHLVSALKELIAVLKDHPAQDVTLIFNGRVLADTHTLEQCGVTPTDFVVCMLKNRHKRPLEEQIPPTTCAAPPVSSQSSSSTLPHVLERLMALGYEEDRVKQALEAAGGEEVAAVDILLGESNPQALNDAFFMRFHPQFLQLREAVRVGPQSIREVLDTVSVQSPQLSPLIQAHPMEVLRILLMPDASYAHRVSSVFAQEVESRTRDTIVNDDTGVGLGFDDPSSDLTPADVEAIDSLTALGFTREAAVQAYLACDRDVSMAATFLFDNPSL